jgi:nitrate reductase delta subunit
VTAGRETVTAGHPAPGRGDAALRAPDANAVILQTASLLLDYPGRASAEVLELVAAALAELPRSAPRRSLERFLAWWRGLSDGEREQAYVATFDFDRTVTLYLSEGRPGTSRERGAVLLDLRRAYRDRGADVCCDELPDYLPLMLEVAAHVPAGLPLLVAEQPALKGLAAVLAERESSFGLVVEAILHVVATASDVESESRA